jgi:hypothetical protein
MFDENLNKGVVLVDKYPSQTTTTGSQFEPVEMRTGAKSRVKAEVSEEEQHKQSRRLLVMEWEAELISDGSYGETIFFEPDGSVDLTKRLKNGVEDPVPSLLPSVLSWTSGREDLLNEFKLIQDENPKLKIEVEMGLDMSSLTYTISENKTN